MGGHRSVPRGAAARSGATTSFAGGRRCPATVTISYDLPSGTDLDLYSMIRAGGLYAAFLALGMEPVLESSWAQALGEAGIGQRQQVRPDHIFDGHHIASWESWER